MSNAPDQTGNGHVRLVCFDWGGVILKIVRSWSEACGRAGLDVRDQSATPEWAARRRPVSSQYQVGRLKSQQFYPLLSKSMDGLYTPAELSLIHDAWLIEEYPGIDAVITRLLDHPRVESALLSNTNHDHWLRQAPIPGKAVPHFPTAARLKHKHGSHILGLAKPGPEIYREFERLTRCSGPGILFFDDLPENIATARALGWRAELIDHTGDTAAQIEAHLRTHGVF